MKKERTIEYVKAEKLLSLGSVVRLKGSNKKVMIVGSIITIQKDEKDKQKIYDYVGCLYPDGIISDKYDLLFYDKDVEEIFDFGYCPNLNYLKRLITQNVVNKKKISIKNVDSNS